MWIRLKCAWEEEEHPMESERSIVEDNDDDDEDSS